ncbi:short chain dehydrogenase/reductase family 16C, member 5a isoform X2 [Myxocyprinus asiaticus]|uniref:short chain dehydrogenase/reductase family 16C, member 5a isoform X2 n=1 Tax=Myxocyprinus asiaticus TaxID=70543 RepID=UPI002222A726|nr:short chain dehydrogenase/reductase family 16C, member 5a isoform X2 [Myxocyprinus asiaticus]
MNLFLETLRLILLTIYYHLEALIKLLIPLKKKDVSGEIVLITGAGHGIGRLMALEFATLDVSLVLWDINVDGLKETARQVRDKGASKVHYYECDCSDRAMVYRVADQTYKAFLPAMTAKNHGHLVSVASSAGLTGVNGLADYCASKFAAVGFAESVALELMGEGKDGVKTTIVCPYFINTGMFDGCKTKWPRLLPILDPDYVAKMIVNAILTDQVYVLLPKSLYVLIALKGLVPYKQSVILSVYFGAFNFMDAFKGREKKQD